VFEFDCEPGLYATAMDVACGADAAAGRDVFELVVLLFVTAESALDCHAGTFAVELLVLHETAVSHCRTSVRLYFIIFVIEDKEVYGDF
jgi:hypothetical protein